MQAVTCTILFSSPGPRYPAADHPEFALPESIPLFCLPSGVPVEHWERHTPFPLPTFSTFALTNAQGQCVSRREGEREREREREGERERRREGRRERENDLLILYLQMYGAVVSFYEPLAEHRFLDDMRKALKANSEVLHSYDIIITSLMNSPTFRRRYM